MTRTFKICTGLLVLIATVLLFSFQQTNVSEQDELLIRDFNSAYMNAFNEHDPDKLSSFWAPNAIYSNLSTHETLQGREEIASYFKDELKNTSDLRLKITVDSMNFDDSGKAIEKGTAVTSSPAEPEKKSFFMAELVRLNNAWHLQKVIEVEDIPPPSHFEELKDLAWFVGKWNSQGEYADFVINTEWDENKNFLLQNFSVLILDQKNLEGKQWIGWDPSKKRIRTWMIDSDGGMGEGFWNKKGDQWYVSMTFTLPDGRKASATHTYKKIDNNTFTFASIDRDVDGMMLPDIKPMTINKVVGTQINNASKAP